MRRNPPLATVGPLRASAATEFKGNGVRDVRCPACGTPLAVHVYMDGDYLRTMPSKYLVRLVDGSYGKSRTGAIGGTGARAIALNPIAETTVSIHCPEPHCGGRLVVVDYASAIG